MSSEHQLRIEKLRRSFDENFAEEFRQRAERKDSFIYFMLGSQGYAVRSSHLTGFAKAGHVTPLPARSRGLLGMGNVRGQLLPVYSLAAFLKVNENMQLPQWLAIAGKSDSIAFAMSELIGLDAADEQHELASPAQPYVQGYCVRGGARFALIQVDELYREITQSNKPQI
jgi:chemotaxis signal transduction protein